MRRITSAFAWSGLGRSMPVQKWYPARAPEEHTLVWELCPSTPQLASTRSVKPSSPGLPTWYMIWFGRFSAIAVLMTEEMSSSASSQLTWTHRPSPPPPRPFQRKQDPVRVGDLVQGGGSLGAVAPAGAGMLGIALELADGQGVAVDVGEQAAGGFAVEAGGRHQHGAAPDPLGVQVGPVVPALPGRDRGQMDPARSRVERLTTGHGVRAGDTDPGSDRLQVHPDLLTPAARTGRPGRRRARRRPGRPGPAAPPTHRPPAR